ncbi:hypothetical protein KFK09_002931 [Dendrobium nobile]|uniref:Uncharacterized protein n=1 Tax=Dendrobium nobile TaxID=94219 RepID=A0A8T3C2R4_DENNO|nr:hypothetical protein KFK09_002931 [Dendrobium nobile]
MATRMDPSFLLAVIAGNMDSVHRLLDEYRTRLYGMTIKGNNILHIAANLGNDWLITEACNNSELDLLLHQNLKGDTILHCAAREGHDRILSLLINHQAGRQMTGMLNRRGDSALHEAARCGHVNAVRWLLAVGENMASIINEDGESPLYLATVRGSVEIVEMLLECPMVEYRGPRGQTALHAAVCRSYGSKPSHYFNNRFNRDGELLLRLVAEAVTSDAPMDPLNVGEMFRGAMGYFYSRPRRQIALHAAIRRSYVN